MSSILALVFAGCAAPGNYNTSNAPTAISNAPTAITNVPSVPVYTQDQLINIGPFELRLDKVYWANHLDTGYGVTQTPQGKFLVVHMVVRNTTKEAVAWNRPLPIFTLVNPDGSEFLSTVLEVNLTINDLSLNAQKKIINPGMTMDGVKIFDVPQASGYLLNLSNAAGTYDNYIKGPPVLRVVLTPASAADLATPGSSPQTASPFPAIATPPSRVGP